MGTHFVAEVFLDTVEIEWGEIFSVWHCLEAIAITAHSDELLDVRVPRRDVVGADRPVDAVALSLRCGELVLAPPLAGASPDQ